MMQHRLPGLRGDDSLGFLAAIGIIALSEQEEIPPLRLAWNIRAGLAAVVESEVVSVDALAQELRAAFERLQASEGVIPGVDTDFPPRKQGVSGGDPMRMSREEMSELYWRAERAHLDGGNPWTGRWLVALAAQLTRKDTERGDVELTPFYAPTGQMSLRVSIFEKTMEAVDAVEGPGDALTRWRRMSYDGANFDERAKRDAGATTSGKADNQGAPSATWLATMGMRFFPMADEASSANTVGWQRVRLYRGYTRRSLVWPLWDAPLDAAAIRALIAHRALRLRPRGRTFEFPESGTLEALGVRRVFGASRRTLQQGDGPLGPAVELWSATSGRTV